MCQTHLSSQTQPRLRPLKSLMLKLQSWYRREFVGAVMELAQRKRGDFRLKRRTKTHKDITDNFRHGRATLTG